MTQVICDEYYECAGCKWKYADKYDNIDEEYRHCPHLIEVTKVKHGEWNVLSRGLTLINAEGTLPLSYQLRQCSECEYVTVAARTETHKWCPHCGARMDLEEESK